MRHEQEQLKDTRDRTKPKSGLELTPYKAPSFALSIPGDWTDCAAFLFAGPPSGPFTPTAQITCDREKEYPSLQAFADEQIKTLVAASFGYKVLSRGPVSLPNGLAAEDVLLMWQGAGEHRLFQRKLFALSGKTAFAVTVVFRDESGKGEDPVAEAIVSSFLPQEEKGK